MTGEWRKECRESRRGERKEDRAGQSVVERTPGFMFGCESHGPWGNGLCGPPTHTSLPHVRSREQWKTSKRDEDRKEIKRHCRSATLKIKSEMGILCRKILIIIIIGECSHNQHLLGLISWDKVGRGRLVG